MVDLSTNLRKRTGVEAILLPAVVVALLGYVLLGGMGQYLSTRQSNISLDLIYQSQEIKSIGRDFTELLGFFLCAFIALLLHFIRFRGAIAMWSGAYWFIIIIALIISSFLWSSVPDIAFRRAARHLLLILTLAGVVVGAASPREIYRLIILLTGVGMTLDVASVILIPSAAVDPDGLLRGLHGGKNGAGTSSMIAVFVWLTAALWSRSPWKRTIFFLGALLWFIFLIGTDSQTAIGSTVLVTLIVLGLRFSVQNALRLFAVILMGIFVLLLTYFVFVLVGYSFDDFVSLLEFQRNTLSARFEVWQIAYNAFLEHMLLGVGYGSLWAIGEVTAAETYGGPISPFYLGLNQAHNGYMDILATMGVVGAVAFLFLLASVIKIGIRALASTDDGWIDPPFAVFCNLIFCATLICNITESSFLTNNTLWVYFVLCYLTLRSALAKRSNLDILSVIEGNTVRAGARTK